MRNKIVVGNWKMNGSINEINSLVADIINGIQDPKFNTLKVAVAPPNIYIPLVAKAACNSNLLLAAQNCAQQISGAFTGEVSVVMLREFSCNFVIVGHSERRVIFGETDEIIAKKFISVYDNSIIPILCVGETKAEREAGITMQVIERQLDAVLKVADVSAFNSAMIAYEPVWAIGTGLSATPEEAEEVHQYIRKKFEKQDSDIAAKLSILYGGSVTAANANTLFAQANIDGGLIGGASLKAKDFLKICEGAINHSNI